MLIYSTADVNAQFDTALRAVVRYRWRHTLSLNKLAAQMRRAGCEIPARTLVDLFAYAEARVTRATPRHRPQRLTKANVVRFAVHLKGNRARAVGIRRRRAQLAAGPVAIAADKA